MPVGRDVQEALEAETEIEALKPRAKRDRGLCQSVRGETDAFKLEIETCNTDAETGARQAGGVVA